MTLVAEEPPPPPVRSIPRTPQTPRTPLRTRDPLRPLVELCCAAPYPLRVRPVGEPPRGLETVVWPHPGP